MGCKAFSFLNLGKKLQQRAYMCLKDSENNPTIVSLQNCFAQTLWDPRACVGHLSKD